MSTARGGEPTADPAGRPLPHPLSLLCFGGIRAVDSRSPPLFLEATASMERSPHPHPRCSATLHPRPSPGRSGAQNTRGKQTLLLESRVHRARGWWRERPRLSPFQSPEEANLPAPMPFLLTCSCSKQASLVPEHTKLTVFSLRSHSFEPEGHKPGPPLSVSPRQGRC